MLTRVLEWFSLLMTPFANPRHGLPSVSEKGITSCNAHTHPAHALSRQKEGTVLLPVRPEKPLIPVSAATRSAPHARYWSAPGSQLRDS